MPRKCRKFLEKAANPGPLSVLKALDKSLMLLLSSTPSWSSSGSCCTLCGRSEGLDLTKLNLVQFCIQSMKPNNILLGFYYDHVDSNETVNGFCANCAQAVTELMEQYNQIRQYLDVFNKARVDLLKTAVTALLVKEKPAMTETLVENVVKFWCDRVGVISIENENADVKVEIDDNDESEQTNAENLEDFMITPDSLMKPEVDFNPYIKLQLLPCDESCIKEESEDTLPHHGDESDDLFNLLESEGCKSNNDDQQLKEPLFERSLRSRCGNQQSSIKRKVSDTEEEDEQQFDDDSDDSSYQMDEGDLSEKEESDLDQDDSDIEFKPTSNVGASVKRKSNIKRTCHKKSDQIKKNNTTGSTKRIRRHEPTQCPLCGKWLSQKQNLTLHLRIHSGEKPYQCKICPLAFYKGSNLKSHIRAAHEKNTSHKCDICGSGFPEKTRLRNHKAVVHSIYEGSDVPLQCSLCDQQFLLPSYLKYHIASSHNKNKPNKVSTCDPCGVSFKLLKDLKAHKKSKEHIQKIKKEQSDNPFTDTKAQAKRTHGVEEGRQKEKKTSGPKPTRRPCTEPGCAEVFPDMNSMMKHRYKAHPDRPKQHQCEICGKSFHDFSNLSKHIRLHSDSYRYHCDQCGEKFHHKSLFKIHMTTHTGTFLFDCEHCSKGFNDIKKLRKHLIESHPENVLKGKPFICKSICWLTFTTQEEYDEHMKRHEKTCKCDICGRMFIGATHVKRHRLTHTGEKPFQCCYCQKAFNSRENLKEHEFRHTGKRPYNCDICQKGFFRKKELTAHKESTCQ